MHFLDIRLHSHLLTDHDYTTVSDIVRHYGCMQAQDIGQAQRVIGSRLPWATQQDIRQALSDWSIVRTRPMRGTLHYMAPEHVHRMLDLCASKTLQGFAKRREFLWISDHYAETALDLMTKALQGKKSLTRSAMGEMLAAWGIPMQTQRVYHLCCYAATRKLICFGPPTDKEETFVLLDDRVAKPKILTHDEQLATLARMYIRGHGSTTVDDLARWTGLWKTECKKAIALVDDEFDTIEQSGKTYYYKTPPHIKSSKSVHLLGWFDEYFIGYKDRSPVADTEHHGKMFTSNGIFFPLILLDGKVAGTWKRTWKKNDVLIDLTPLPGIKLPIDLIKHEAEKYAQFRGKEKAIITK